MANAYEAGAAGLPFAVFRGYRGAELPRVNPNIKSVTCPYTGEVLATVPAMRSTSPSSTPRGPTARATCCSRASSACRRRRCSAAKRALVTVEEIVDELGPRSLNACILPRWTVTRHRRGARRRASLLRARLLQARQRLLRGLGRDRPRPRHASTAWMQTATCCRQGARGLRRATPARRPPRAKAQHERRRQACLDAHRDDDRRRGAGAQERRRLLRRHRRAVGGLQPRAPHARARHHADLRVRHHRHQAQRAAALDRRRRAVRDGAHHRLGAGDVPLLAAGRPHHRRLPGRRADRPLRQPQHHRDRPLRQAEDPPARRRRRAGDRHRLRRDLHHHGAVRARSSSSSISSPRSATARAAAAASAWASRPRGRRASSPTCARWSPTRRPAR